jgi:serine/threonine-protein kinase/endoribonuclease IRE1
VSAPEVFNGETQMKPPHAADIYSLGLIFAFTMCGGKHPYDEEMKSREKRMKNGKPMLEIIQKQLIDEYGGGSFELINRMLDLNPEKRPTVAEVLENDFFLVPSSETRRYM